jgi:hypothetical protein
MSWCLVGSEMCIRDRTKAPTRFSKQCLQDFEPGLTAKNLDELGFVHSLMLI